MKNFLMILLIINLFSYKDRTIDSINISSPSAILIDYQTEIVLYQKNSHQKRKMASMIKMMGVYLVLELVSNKKISLDDKVEASLAAKNMGGSQIYLEEGEILSVDELLKAVLISSANDAMYALSEFCYGTNSNFIMMMNRKAREFNLKNTHYSNVTGFDEDDNYTTCYDNAILALRLLKDFGPFVLKYSKLKSSYLRENSSKPFCLNNTNTLIGRCEGVDGLKSGFTNQAKFCLTATSLRNNIRLISTVMGSESKKMREDDSKTLLNYGYNLLVNKKIYSKNEIVAKIEIKGVKEKINLISKEDIYLVFLKNAEVSYKKKIEIVNDSLPILKNRVVAYLVIEYQNIKLRFPLYVKEDVKRVSYFNYLIKEYLKLLL